MQMETLVAAAVLGPAVGAVAAYNAWAIYIHFRDRRNSMSDRNGPHLDCLTPCE
jgi:hypothetical protein